MSTPENVLAGYDDTSKEGQLVIQRVKTLTSRYKRTGINKENISGVVCTLMMEVNKIKTLSGLDKKELVIDLIYSIIEEIDDGEEDSEFEVILKRMVPPMIDSFSAMLKVTKGCGCFGK